MDKASVITGVIGVLLLSLVIQNYVDHSQEGRALETEVSAANTDQVDLGKMTKVRAQAAQIADQGAWKVVSNNTPTDNDPGSQVSLHLVSEDDSQTLDLELISRSHVRYPAFAALEQDQLVTFRFNPEGYSESARDIPNPAYYLEPVTSATN
ncbi:MAG TPA: hypothetical protein VEC17_02300 [Candidatus Binatia bacterium]|nr:hypothetical protein [Candidatus Binatia bacterium]